MPPTCQESTPSAGLSRSTHQAPGSPGDGPVTRLTETGLGPCAEGGSRTTDMRPMRVGHPRARGRGRPRAASAPSSGRSRRRPPSRRRIMPKGREVVREVRVPAVSVPSRRIPMNRSGRTARTVSPRRRAARPSPWPSCRPAIRARWPRRRRTRMRRRRARGRPSTRAGRGRRRRRRRTCPDHRGRTGCGRGAGRRRAGPRRAVRQLHRRGQGQQPSRRPVRRAQAERLRTRWVTGRSTGPPPHRTPARAGPRPGR